jgi:AmiR/NasT family two-component response regulator
MRVWLLQGPGSSRPDLLTALIGQPPDTLPLDLRVEQRSVGPALAEEVRASGPDVLVLCHTSAPPGPWLPELLEAGPALVAVVPPERAGEYAPLAERHPVHLVPDPPCPAALCLAVLTAGAARRRQVEWKRQVADLRRRLDDRIVIERAKGVLAQGCGLSEEEAYKRLRVLSRQQRRPVREIAQTLLDTRGLLMPTQPAPDALAEG